MDSFRVHLLVGLPGSGKSAWAKRRIHCESDLVIINRDELRTSLFGRYRLDSYIEPIVNHLARKAAAFAARKGMGIIINEPNLTRNHREEWVDLVTSEARSFDRELFLNVVHCTESEVNVAHMCQGGELRGHSIYRWGQFLRSFKDRFEPVERDEFPDGTYFDEFQISE